MFENVGGQMDAGVTGILLAHPSGSGELKNQDPNALKKVITSEFLLNRL